MAYLILFASAFGAATILPFYSEAVLLAYMRQGYVPLGLWAAATAGNTLGAHVNWLIGLYLLHYQNRWWFPVKPASLHKAQERFRRYGAWSLLLAWLPVGGDALTFVGGIMRVPFWLFTLLVAAGKGARYAAILWLGAQALT
jgi:membrane protein YqaA with SNARE-associated domain